MDNYFIPFKLSTLYMLLLIASSWGITGIWESPTWQRPLKSNGVFIDRELDEYSILLRSYLVIYADSSYSISIVDARTVDSPSYFTQYLEIGKVVFKSQNKIAFQKTRCHYISGLNNCSAFLLPGDFSLSEEGLVGQNIKFKPLFSDTDSIVLAQHSAFLQEKEKQQSEVRNTLLMLVLGLGILLFLVVYPSK